MTTEQTSSKRFFHVVLRTLDEPAAREFYAAVLGVNSAELIAFPLHEAAVARGARPHWLGFIDVGDVPAAATAFIERGASALGPRWVNPEGLEAAVMRDPGGALVALAKHPSGMSRQPFEVAWFVLNTTDLDRAKKTYGELFGWDFRAPEDVLGQATFHPFAWQAGGPTVGSMSEIAGRPGVHPHWIFLLHVASIDHAVAEVRARGGLIAAELTLPGADRVAVCDDPQGAAFALTERANAAR